MTPYRLDAQHELKGTWWIPDDPSVRFQGRLFYAPGWLALDCDQETTLAPDLFATNTRSLVFGDIGGVPVTLIDSTEFTTSYLFDARMASKRLHPRAAVFGAHCTVDPLCSEAFVSFQHLEDWLRRPTFSQRLPVGRGKTVTVRYRSPKVPSERVKRLNAQIEFQYHCTVSPEDYQRQEIAAEAVIRVRPRFPQPSSWFNDVYWHVRLLLTLLVGRTTSPRYVQARLESLDSGSGKVVSVLLGPSAGVDVPSGRPVRVAFPYETVRNAEPAFLSAWFELMSGARIAVEVFASALTNSGMYPHQYFSLLVQALETLHRHTEENRLMPEAEFDLVRKAMMTAAPHNIGRELRESLASKIKYANEPSLRRRLKNLFDGLDGSLRQFICTDRKTFLDKVVNTRNYYSHWPSDMDESARLSAPEFPGAIAALRVMLICVLVQRLGLPASVVLNRLEDQGYRGPLFGLA